MICPTCHGNGILYNGLLQEHRPCVDCNGSGIAYCCEHYDDVLTHGVTMKENVIRIEYRDFQVNTDQSGWYLFEYKTIADMNEDIPCDVVGPFATRAAASRSALESSDIKDRREREHKNERTPSAPVTAAPTSLDAGIPTDNDDCDDEEPTSEREGVHMELQQTQELRDVSPEVQSD